MKLMTLRFPGRPWLTLLSTIGSILFFAGGVPGSLMFLARLPRLEVNWLGLAMIAGGGVGFGLIWLSLRLAQR
jgi:hypothetical protein